MNSKVRNDILLVAAVLLASVLLGMYGRMKGGGTADPTVVITVDSSEVYRGPASGLGENGLTVEGYHGGSNLFIMEKDEKGRIGIRCTEADCPDKICIQTGLVTMPDEPVVCLPHRVMARIVEDAK